MSLDLKLDQVVRRHDELQAQLSGAGLDAQRFAQASKEYADLGPLVDAIRELRAVQNEVGDLQTLAADTSADSDMRALADEELRAARERLPGLERRVRLMLLPKDAADERNAILEVRAGTGGEEAALFAGELFRMYQRYAAEKGWRFEIMEMSETGLGGLKDGTATVSGRGVFARLKFESGVHRVQRVPQTEASGRIHTSAATVAVLPEAEEVDVKIDDKDLRIDVFRASGPGGQSVNTTDSAVRITHLPTGIVVACQNERSQHQNRETAMRIVKAKLLERHREEHEQKIAGLKGAHTDAAWGNQIRSYVLHPYSMVKDHRTGCETGNPGQVLDGEINDFVEAYLRAKASGNWQDAVALEE